MGKRRRGRGFYPYQHTPGPPPHQIFLAIGAMQTAMNFTAKAPNLAGIKRKLDAAGRAGWRVPDVWVERIRAIPRRETNAAFRELVELYMQFAREVRFPRGWTSTDCAGALFIIYCRIERGEPVFPET